MHAPHLARFALFALSSLVTTSFLACSSDDAAPSEKKDAGGNEHDAAPKFPKPEADDCITSTKAGKQMLECEGLKFILTVPEACLSEACGLITDVHGYGMDGQMQANHSRIDMIGGEHGYITVHPYAPGKIPTSSWSQTGANDDQVLAIMQRVIAVFHVDEDRVHMSGYSQGGFMTWRFLCKHSELLASVAPMAAGTGCPFTEADHPEFERSVFYTHGTTDGLVPFSTAYPQRDALIAYWKLKQTDSVSMGDDHEWTRYENDAGTTFEFAQHDWETTFVLGTRPLRGHCFPGVHMLLGCGEDTAMDWGKSVVDFFVAHPRVRKED